MVLDGGNSAFAPSVKIPRQGFVASGGHVDIAEVGLLHDF